MAGLELLGTMDGFGIVAVLLALHLELFFAAAQNQEGRTLGKPAS